MTNIAYLADQPSEREITISVYPGDYVEYEGTADQLLAEGLIADGFEWPRAAADAHWEVDGFDFRLRRTRPTGHKGPMRSWLEMDNWLVRVRKAGMHWCQRRAVEQKAEALRDEIHRQSAAGQREWEAHYRRYSETQKDKAFLAFKSILVPERKKSGRKPGGTSNQGHSH